MGPCLQGGLEGIETGLAKTSQGSAVVTEVEPGSESDLGHGSGRARSAGTRKDGQG